MTDTHTLTLSEWLLARIAEDETYLRSDCGDFARECQECAFLSDYQNPPYSVDRLLAECEAKRRIIEEHPIATDLSAYSQQYGGHSFGCTTCHEWDGIIMGAGYCPTLRALALPYADHPEFREEWRA